MEAKRGCKIRKRGCSSSSSSSLARRSRFKRAILVGKRTAASGGWSGTPVKPRAAGKSPVLMVSPEKLQTGFQGSSVSARKLAATLWEIGNGISPPRTSTGDCLRGKQLARSREKALTSSQKIRPNLSDPISGLCSDRTNRSTGDPIRRTAMVSQKLQVIDYKSGGMDSMENGRRGKCSLRLKDVNDSLTTSKEILKVLTLVQGNDYDDDQQTPSKRLISALFCELERARSILKCSIKDHRVTSEKEIQCLMECFAEEKSEWRRRERARIQELLMSVSREIGVERKLRKETERVNKKLGRELTNTKVMLSKVMKDLESEKRAKEILGQVCDELARGAGEDKAEVEKLRKEAGRIKEEVEKEREMMQIADILREERVQMKLSEAKYQFEEKNAAVEQLRSELEDYIRGKIDGGGGGDRSTSGIKKIKAILEKHTRCQATRARDEDRDGGISDQDSDLQSIELNMDSNSKSYKWSYVEPRKMCRRNSRRQKGMSFVGRDSAHNDVEDSSDDSIGRRSLVLDFQTPNPNTNCVHRQPESLDGLSGRKSRVQDQDRDQDRDQEEEIDRDKSIKNLRDYIISNMSDVNPSKQLNQSMPCQGSDHFFEEVSN